MCLVSLLVCAETPYTLGRLARPLRHVPKMAGGGAEDKITAALNRELEMVEKECMRSMQVRQAKFYNLNV